MRAAAVTTVTLITACGGGSGGNDPIITEPVRYYEVDLTLAGPDLAAAAPAYVLGFAADLDLSDRDDLAVLAVATGPDSLRHARLQQTHDGVPVLGSEIIAHADESTFLGYSGVVTRYLDGFDTAPTLGDGDALAIAVADRGAAMVFEREETRLVIQPRDPDGADLAYEIELANEGQDAADPGRWFYLIDARSGAVLRAFDGLTTLEQASGPGGNARRAWSWSAQLDVEPKDGEYLMETSRQVTLDMKTQTTGGDPARAAALDDFTDPNVNDAHGFTEITLDMMREWTGTDSIDGNGFVIVSRVHIGKNVDVASWDGKHTNFGDSNPATRYPRPGSLDIVAHETNHGYTEKHSHLVYAEQSGGLNESFSDIAGTMAEFFHEGESADFNIGEDIYIAADGVHRFMCNPSAKAPSIDHMSKYQRGQEVHSSSGIGNKAFCLSVARFKADSGATTVEAVRRVGLAWYAANAAYWTSTSNFTQACQGVVDGARSLGYSSQEIAQINQSWADVGIHCDGAPVVCDQDDTCEPTVGETCASCAADCDPCSQECGFFKRMKCKIGIGDCSRCGLEPGCGDGVCSEDEDDQNCGQDCGCAAPGDTCGSVAPYGCFCDNVCQVRDDCCADRDQVCGS